MKRIDESKGYVEMSEVVDKINEIVDCLNDVRVPVRKPKSAINTITLTDQAQALFLELCEETGLKKSSLVSELVMAKAREKGIR